MAVANLHYITRMSSGFKVYILEGQPSLRAEERFRPLSSHRMGPPLVYPVKRKYSPERDPSSEAAAVHVTKMRQSPIALTISKTLDGQNCKAVEKEKRPCLAAMLKVQTPPRSPVERPYMALPRSPAQASSVHSPAQHVSEFCPRSPRRGSPQSSPSECLSTTGPQSPRRTSPQHSPAQRFGAANQQSLVWVSPPHSPVERAVHSPAECNATPSPAGHAYSLTASLYEPMDEPLALIKNPRESSKVNSVTLSSVQTSILQQQMRPSVITCVSSSNRNGGDSSTPSTGCCTGCLSSNVRREAKAMAPACDPVVEEHFRRSLGRNYQQPDLSHCVSTTGSVDDHFAKALGDKWLKLKAARDASLAECSPQRAGSPTSTSCSSHCAHSPINP